MNYVYENDGIHESADDNESGIDNSQSQMNEWKKPIPMRDTLIHDPDSMMNHTISIRSNPTSTAYTGYDVDVDIIETHHGEKTKQPLPNYEINISTNMMRTPTTKDLSDYTPAYQRRISIRRLQPPPIEIGTNVTRSIQPRIQQKKIIIREKPEYIAAKPPLVLRERPPTPPAYTEDETVEEELPPIEGPPIVVVERYAAPIEQPRDIHIERWCKYPVESRSTGAIESEPILMKQEPTLEIVEYEPGPAKVIRKFERLGISRENPKVYESLYGSMLLDRATLEQKALEAGVTENIACECPLVALNDTFHESAPLKYVEDNSFHDE